MKFWLLEDVVPLQNSIQFIRQRGFKRRIPVLFALILFLKHSAPHVQDMQFFYTVTVRDVSNVLDYCVKEIV